MIEFTTQYVVSQVFTIIHYGLLGSTYYAKSRKTILIMVFIAIIFNAMAYALQSAWSGFAMSIVAIMRNIIFTIDENKNDKRDNITKKDIIILLILFAVSIVLAIFTYEGFLSLLSVIGTMLYTYSVWQKKTKVYKILGIPVSLLFIIYFIYIKSIFGIILESILLIASTTGYILEVRNNKEYKNI